MKWLLGLFVLGITLVLMSIYGALYPYYMFDQVIGKGVTNGYLKLGPYTKKTLRPSEFTYERTGKKNTVGSNDQARLWRSFQFSSFKIPIPVRHPSFLFIPNIEYDKKSGITNLGIEIADSKKDPLLEYFQRDAKRVDFSFETMKLFSLPYFRKDLAKKPLEQIWKDVFTKEISSIRKASSGWGSYIEAYKKISYKELVYDLYILMLRDNVFSSDVKGFSYEPKKKLGILRFSDDSERMGHEHLLWYEDGLAHVLELKTKNSDLRGDFLRKKFIQGLEYRQTSDMVHVALYAEFKSLPFARQIDQEGLVFLYTAWSHQVYKKEFLRDMISFLERGENNYIHLSPIYNYSLEKYGTTFSSRDRRESAKERLRRQARQDYLKSLRDAKKGADTGAEDIDSMSDKERVDYYLKNAKEAGSDLDSESDEIDGI